MIQVPEQASLHGFSTNTHTVQQILEEAARSLKLLWRVSLPLKAAHGTAQGTQVLLGFIWALLVWLGVWDGFLGSGSVSKKMHQLQMCYLGKSLENHDPSLWTHGFRARAEYVLIMSYGQVLIYNILCNKDLISNPVT